MSDTQEEKKAGDRHWLESLYETFIIRDLIGYAGPGSILVLGLMCELGKTQFLKSIILSWSGIAILISSSYIAATGLRLLGTFPFIVLFHNEWAILARPRKTGAEIEKTSKAKVAKFFWRGDEGFLRDEYMLMTEKERTSTLARERIFIHITGLTSMALLVLALSVSLLGHDGISKSLGISQTAIIIAMVLASFVFLMGHYRHRHQAVVLRELIHKESPKDARNDCAPN